MQNMRKSQRATQTTHEKKKFYVSVLSNVVKNLSHWQSRPSQSPQYVWAWKIECSRPNIWNLRTSERETSLSISIPICSRWLMKFWMFSILKFHVLTLAFWLANEQTTRLSWKLVLLCCLADLYYEKLSNKSILSFVSGWKKQHKYFFFLVVWRVELDRGV